MANTSTSLDKWRDYFGGANSDIFDIIKHAIMVAASDCPTKFKQKRDSIAEMLFTCRATKCCGCDGIALVVPNGDRADKGDVDKCTSAIEASGGKDSKESKVNSSSGKGAGGDRGELVERNVNEIGSQSYGDVEALSDEIEEESHVIEEVLRIKRITDGSGGESDTLLLESLRRLQLMPVSVGILKITEIGKSVNALRKHISKEIRNLVRTIINDWKSMANEWYNSTAAITDAEVTKESVKTPEAEEEVGLPSPPLDEGAFLATPGSMDLSKFFDGMDDDGNPQDDGEYDKSPDIPKGEPEKRNDSSTPPRSNQEPALQKEGLQCEPNWPLNGLSRPARPKPPPVAQGPKPEIKNEVKVHQNFEKGTIQKKPSPLPQEKLNGNNDNDEASFRVKLEAAKRKLHERCEEAEKAKKKRMIKVLELKDLPKQSWPRGIKACGRHQPSRRAVDSVITRHSFRNRRLSCTSICK